MGLTISSYLADKYLIDTKTVEDSDDFFFNTSQNEEESDVDTLEKSIYIVMFNNKIKGYIETQEQVKYVINDVKLKVFRQLGFSNDYICYWREVENNQEEISELENGEIVYEADFLQKNRNLVISYESILHSFKIIKTDSLSNKIKVQ